MHGPTSCTLLACGSSHETSEGKVTCWYWWGKASCLKNRTAFYSLALPGACQATHLASKFRKVNNQTGQLTCSKLLVYLPCLSTGLV